MSASINIFTCFNKKYDYYTINEKINESNIINIESTNKSQFHSETGNDDFQYFGNGMVNYAGKKIPVGLDYPAAYTDIVFVHNFLTSDSDFFFEYPSFFVDLKSKVDDCFKVGHDNFGEVSHSTISLNFREKPKLLTELGVVFIW